MDDTTNNYKHKFEDLISMYEVVCDWFDKLGFSYTRNRYGIYKKYLHDFQSMVSNKSFPKDREGLINFKRGFDNAYVEVHEIIRAYNGLKSIDSKEFHDQIKKVASGHEFRANSENDQARDFLFELTTASRFVKAGYRVSLTGICDIVVDLASGGMLFVECKRIKSIKKIGVNVKKANKQIAKRINFARTSKVKGLVAINVTDLLPQTKDLLPDLASAATEIHRGVSNKFTRENIGPLSEGMNKKCFGVMCESAKMHYLSHSSDIQGFTYSRHTDFLPYYEDELFRRLSAQLSNQDIK
ncbi:hypothetical protein [Microbulbifer agarilyticus]|uniref:hypothetical protein n=1 Tax=Microbulbifer agarilyticus TaxID=260552 RepID=UPI001CD4239B|nr:hypothetical protein [Microbulbifer agarilyticus]MCA0901467.1 hypothetical protein [Microbulbifer agarilyticus]